MVGSASHAILFKQGVCLLPFTEAEDDRAYFEVTEHRGKS